jgi:predicted XRE-type DNA-binding protein
MPSPESSRMNLNLARANGRVKVWRLRSESQRIKAGIVLLHETQPDLSQRAIARTFGVCQPYVHDMLEKVREQGIEKALGEEATGLFRMGMEVHRQARFQAAARTAEQSQGVSIPNPWKNMHTAGESSWAFEESATCATPIVPESAVVRDHDPAIAMEKVDETGARHQFARTTTGELIEVYDSGCNTPGPTAPAYVPGTHYCIQRGARSNPALAFALCNRPMGAGPSSGQWF